MTCWVPFKVWRFSSGQKRIGCSIYKAHIQKVRKWLYKCICNNQVVLSAMKTSKLRQEDSCYFGAGGQGRFSWMKWGSRRSRGCPPSRWRQHQRPGQEEGREARVAGDQRQSHCGWCDLSRTLDPSEGILYLLIMPRVGQRWGEQELWCRRLSVATRSRG